MRPQLVHRINRCLTCALVVIALGLSAATAFADTQTVTFYQDFVIGGTKLPAGDYTLVTANGRVTVKADRKVVAQATVRWEARDDTPAGNTVLYGENNQVIEIRFAHQHGVMIVVTP
jgi:hypothetical protein